MSCGGGHLGFPIGIKNRSQFISCREEDLWNFSQSEHIIGPGSHVEYPTGTKNRHVVEDHPRNIPAKFGSNWPSCVGEEAWNVKSLDDGQRTPSDGNSSSGPGELKKINWLFVTKTQYILFLKVTIHIYT
jgi:hypothetical protein